MAFSRHQGAASPPCRPVQVCQSRYGRCIEIGSHLHCYFRASGGGFAALSSQCWFASWLWQMHRDRVSHRHCRHWGRLRRLVVSVLVHQWRYGRYIEIAPHLHRYCWHQGRLRRLVVSGLVHWKWGCQTSSIAIRNCARRQPLLQQLLQRRSNFCPPLLWNVLD